MNPFETFREALDIDVRDRGYTSPETRMLLMALAANFRNPKVLELGTYTGKTAQALAWAGAEVHAVDREPDPVFAELTADLSRVDLIRMDVMEFLAGAQATYDVIFIDLDRTADIRNVCEVAKAVLEPAGIIVVHDVDLYDWWDTLLEVFVPTTWEGIRLPAWPTPGESHHLGVAVFRRREKPWAPARKSARRARKKSKREAGSGAGKPEPSAG